MSAGAPYFAQVEQLRKLNGEPRLSNDYGDPAYSPTERLIRVTRADLAAGTWVPGETAEPDAERFPEHVLIVLREIGTDGNLVEVGLRFERFPGIEIVKPDVDEEKGTNIVTYRQRVLIDQTSARPNGAVRIASVVASGSDALFFTAEGHGYDGGSPQMVSVLGVVGGTAVDGSRSAHYLTPTAFTVTGLTISSTPTAGTGAVIPTYNGFPILDSYIEPENSIVATLVTVTAGLPGRTVSNFDWGIGGLMIRRDETTVQPGTRLTGGTNVAGEKVVALDIAQSRHIVETYVDANGIPLAAGAAVETLELRDGHFEVTHYFDYLIVPANYVLPLEGSAYPSSGQIGEVLDVNTQPVEGSPNLIAEIHYIRALPLPRVDMPTIPFDFPGVFEQLQPWWNFDNVPGPLRRPYVGKGLDVNVIEPKRLSQRGRRISFYTYGPANDPQNLFSTDRLSGNFFLPPVYGVVTPGTGSKIYRGLIHENMIHPAFIAYQSDGNGNLIVTENFDASTPASYDPADILVAHSSSVKWVHSVKGHGGRVYENIIEQVSETTPPEQFPPLTITVPLYATPPVTIQRNGKLFGKDGFGFDGGTALNLFSSASDTRTVKIVGRVERKNGPREGPYHSETITLNGTTPVQTIEQRWYKIFQITLSGTSANTVNVTMPGAPGSGTILAATASLTTGDTLTLARTFNGATDTRVFTFRPPGSTSLVCGTKATLPANAYFVVHDQYGATAFWYYTGSETAPGAMHRTVKIDISGVSLAPDVFAATVTAVLADVAAETGLPQFDVDADGTGTNQLVITERYLDLRTASAFGSGGFGGAWAISMPTTGTAAAANQIRVAYFQRCVAVVVGVRIYESADQQTNTNIAEAIGNNAAAVLDGACSASTSSLSYEAMLGVSTPDGVTNTVNVLDTQNSAFTFSKTGTGLTVASPSGYGSEQLLATFGVNQTSAFKAIPFNDLDLAQLDLPGGVTVVSDPVALGGRVATFVMSAGPEPGDTGFPMAGVGRSYEVSFDGLNWEASGDTLGALANGTVHEHSIPNHTFTTPPTGAVQPNYVRVTFNNSAGANRAVSAYVSLLIS